MFGSTKCGKCEGSSFKLQELEMQGAAFKMMAAQCTHCQTPFGVADFYNVGQLLKKQEKAIEGLERKIDYIQSNVGQILNALQGMRR